MKYEEKDDIQEEAFLEEIFEKSAPEPPPEALNRLQLEAVKIPGRLRSQPWWRRVLRPMLFAPLASGAIALLLILVWGQGLIRDSGTASLNPNGLPVNSTPLTDSIAAWWDDDAPVPDELESADPFQLSDWESDDSSGLVVALDPAHSAYLEVDEQVWIEVYDSMLKNDF